MSLQNLPQAYNSIQSQKFGRRVYKVKQGDQTFWLKLQLNNANQDYQNGFLNELDVYKKLNLVGHIDQNVLSNFRIFDPYLKFCMEEDVIDQALWVEDVPALFVQSPNELDLPDISTKLMQSLDVLGHLHDLGFVHGDLKVEHFRHSILGSALIDYEQCKHISDVAKMSNTATPRYMAPELFHAEAKSFTTDLYALGVIWLEWLTQRRLSAKSYQDWAILHCQQLSVDIPERFKALEYVLKSMLMKKVEQRCINIYQIKQQLSQIA